MKYMSLKNVSLVLTLTVLSVHASDKSAVAKSATKPAAASTQAAPSIFTDLTNAQVKLDLNFRIIDAFKIMHESEIGKEASQLLASTNDKYQAELGSLQAQIQQDMANFQAKAQTMGEAARERAAKNIKKAQVEFELLAKERQEDFQILQQKQTEKMLTAIRESAKEIAMRDGIDVIADKATGQVLYSSEKADLSNQVVQSMNVQFAANKAKTATAVAKADAKKDTATA